MLFNLKSGQKNELLLNLIFPDYPDRINQNTLIAEMNGVIIGFGSIDKSGCLDLLFVHKDYQKQGVARNGLFHKIILTLYRNLYFYIVV